jgi:hypothetical protein
MGFTGYGVSETLTTMLLGAATTSPASGTALVGYDGTGGAYIITCTDPPSSPILIYASTGSSSSSVSRAGQISGIVIAIVVVKSLLIVISA